MIAQAKFTQGAAAETEPKNVRVFVCACARAKMTLLTSVNESES